MHLQDMQHMRREMKGDRLSLTDLLAKPHQRIPRYRLLIQRLLEHTDSDHVDYPLLRRAEREIHELALKISAIQTETSEQVSRICSKWHIDVTNDIIATGKPAEAAEAAGAVGPRPRRQRPRLADALPRAARPRGHDQRAVGQEGQVPLPLQRPPHDHLRQQEEGRQEGSGVSELMYYNSLRHLSLVWS